MNRNGRLSKFLWPVLALILLVGAAYFQSALNRLRADPELRLTRVEPLENAPPVLAFTTVALGGFRGLIANVLWIRATELQDEGKYFEMVQLADWITKLEPHFTQVWLVQAWNMAYNISVKFPQPEDRWRWVQRGIELLRDEGLKYNPREALIYRELAWFYQHKMGQNMDNAHLYFKAAWARNMTEVLGGGSPDYEALLEPDTDEERERVRQLREVYKMDPAVIKKVDETYGPLDWRLPEPTAMYWAVVGLERSRPEDTITLRRVIYQCMQVLTLRGRLFIVPTSEGDQIRLSPHLDLAEKANAAYERMMIEDEANRDIVERAHRNFLREVIFLMYSYNRFPEAQRWMSYARDRYQDVIPPDVSLDEFALANLTENFTSFTQDRLRALVDGMLTQSYLSQAVGEEDRALGLREMARRIVNYYQETIAGQEERLTLGSLSELAARKRDELLRPGGLDPVLQARLRTALGLPPPTNAPPAQMEEESP